MATDTTEPPPPAPIFYPFEAKSPRGAGGGAAAKLAVFYTSADTYVDGAEPASLADYSVGVLSEADCKRGGPDNDVYQVVPISEHVRAGGNRRANRQRMEYEDTWGDRRLVAVDDVEAPTVFKSKDWDLDEGRQHVGVASREIAYTAVLHEISTGREECWRVAPQASATAEEHAGQHAAWLHALLRHAHEAEVEAASQLQVAAAVVAATTQDN